MAKVTLSKILDKKEIETKTITIKDQEVIVQQYLPIEKKVELLTEVGAAAIGNKWINPMLMDSMFITKVIEYYTNISFSEKQKQDHGKTFDKLIMNGIVDAVLAAVPNAELQILTKWLERMAESITKYNNSALGIMENLANNYDETKFDVEDLAKTLDAPQFKEIVKTLTDKDGLNQGRET